MQQVKTIRVFLYNKNICIINNPPDIPAKGTLFECIPNDSEVRETFRISEITNRMRDGILIADLEVVSIN